MRRPMRETPNEIKREAMPGGFSSFVQECLLLASRIIYVPFKVSRARACQHALYASRPCISALLRRSGIVDGEGEGGGRGAPPEEAVAASASATATATAAEQAVPALAAGPAPLDPVAAEPPGAAAGPLSLAGKVRAALVREGEAAPGGVGARGVRVGAGAGTGAGVGAGAAAGLGADDDGILRKDDGILLVHAARGAGVRMAHLGAGPIAEAVPLPVAVEPRFLGALVGDLGPALAGLAVIEHPGGAAVLANDAAVGPAVGAPLGRGGRAGPCGRERGRARGGEGGGNRRGTRRGADGGHGGGTRGGAGRGFRREAVVPPEAGGAIALQDGLVRPPLPAPEAVPALRVRVAVPLADAQVVCIHGEGLDVAVDGRGRRGWARGTNAVVKPRRSFPRAARNLLPTASLEADKAVVAVKVGIAVALA